MKPLVATLLSACIVASVPFANAILGPDPHCQDNTQTHCPCHPQHCYGTGKLPLVAGGAASGLFAMQATDGSSLAYPPTALRAGSDATFVVLLTLADVPAGETRTVTVDVGPTPGLVWSGATSATLTLTGGADATSVTFPLHVIDLWPAGDYIFAPVTLGADGQSVSSYMSVHVPDLPATGSPPAVLASMPLPGAALVAVVIAGAALLAGRRAR
jgi:hypothetical protein